MPLNNVFEAPTLVSTETLLLKHYYRRQGVWQNPGLEIGFKIFSLLHYESESEG